MSDTVSEPVEPFVDPNPPATIEVTVDDEPGSPAEATDVAADRLNIDEYGAKLIPIKVGGEEQWVPLSEAQQGYMRQQDYTQKTQATAAERESLSEARAIAEALRNDPEGTLEVLRDWYTTDEDTPDADDASDMDPVLRELKEWKDSQDKKAQDDALEAELVEFETKYNVPKDELLRFAVENNIPNLGWAYAVMQTTTDGAAQQLQQRTDSAEAGRVAAKQGLAGHGGADRASGSSAAPTGSASNVGSVADAWRLAARQLTRS